MAGWTVMRPVLLGQYQLVLAGAAQRVARLAMHDVNDVAAEKQLLGIDFAHGRGWCCRPGTWHARFARLGI